MYSALALCREERRGARRVRGDGWIDGWDGMGGRGGEPGMESRECFVGDEEEGETGPEITTKMR